MRKSMLLPLINWAQANPKILEVGAGTGILSGEVLEFLRESNSAGKILSIEYDEQYFDYLSEQLKVYPDFVTIQKDAKTYDPPGKFDLIFSSFADHHIVTNDDDANKYYKNIKGNLFPGSVFIVGDEFLRDHDYKNPEERIQAIQAYHRHIIEQARMEMQRAPSDKHSFHQGLIELETEAMRSGIEAVNNPSSKNAGDYKVSIAHFKKRVEQAGLHIDQITAIGPNDETIRASVGGIYVIQIRLP